jgi:Zn-dependent protease with chaperone function
MESNNREEILRIHKALNKTGFRPSWKLDYSGHAYVYITAGAGYTNIYLSALPTEYNKIKNDLYAAVSAGGDSVSEYYQTTLTGCTAKMALIRKSKYGANQVINHFRLGEFIAELKSRGYKPFVLLRVPEYASCEFTNVEKNNLPTLARNRHTWYNATDVPRNATISVSASVSTALSAFIVYIRFILPAIGLLAILVGLFAGLNRRLPIKTRTLTYDWGMFICLLTFFAGIAYYMTFQSSLFGRMINDIWYADPRNQHALASSLIGIGVLFIIVLIMLPVRTRIFKGLDEEPDIEDMDTIIVRLRKSGRIVIGIGLGFLAYLFVMSPLQVGGYFGSESSFGAFAPLFTFFLFRWMQRQYYNPSSHDETLTVRAKELALRMGVDIDEVRVVTSDIAKNNAGGFFRYAKKIVYVTQKAKEILSPGQMDYILGHELAHSKDIKLRRKVLSIPEFCLLVIIMLTVLFVFMFSYATSMLVLWLIGFVFAALLFHGIYSTDLSRRLEYEADMQAVIAVGDPDMAISALQATYENRANKANLDDDTGIHPKLSKRIKAMQIAGEKLGNES